MWTVSIYSLTNTDLDNWFIKLIDLEIYSQTFLDIMSEALQTDPTNRPYPSQLLSYIQNRKDTSKFVF